MTRIMFWPCGLFGRVIFVLLGAVLLEFVGTMALHEQAAAVFEHAGRTGHLAERLALADRVLAASPPQERTALARVLSTGDVRIAWMERPPPDAGPAVPGQASAEEAALAEVRARLIAAEPALAQVGLDLARGGGDAPDPAGTHLTGTHLTGTHLTGTHLTGTLRLVDGSALAFAASMPVDGPVPLHHPVLTGLVLAASVLLTAAMLVRALGAPLRLLARAADGIGHGPAVAVPEAGPGEVSRLARAFNAMQRRIAALVADRTAALAAISHDLRTPIARCRLRAGFLDDAELQTAFEEDFDEMEAMIASVLAHLRSEADAEERRPVDLAALLRTLVDAAADAGRAAGYGGADHLVAALRPLAMKRAFANLIENALAYGGTARVWSGRDGASIRVRVDDDGPGIPVSEIARVMEPFQRLETSRGRGTGGTGLGLTIARGAVEREGGRLTLHNRPEGGLRAEVVLPDTDAPKRAAAL